MKSLRPDGRIRLFAHYTASLSSLCRWIWRYYLNNCQVHSFECVSQKKSILSIIYHAIHGTACFRLTNFSYDDCMMIVIISVLYLNIIIKSGSLTQLPLFMVRSWNNSRRCMPFYILTMMKWTHDPVLFQTKLLLFWEGLPWLWSLLGAIWCWNNLHVDKDVMYYQMEYLKKYTKQYIIK